MARTKAAEPLDLTVPLHLRISPEASEMLRTRARKQGIPAATLGRQLLYRGLGLIKGKM